MSPNKSPNIIRYSVITSTTAIVLIFISLIPVSKKAFFETGIKEINIRTIAVVDVITLYLMIFGLLFGDIKKEGVYPSMLDRLSIKIILVFFF